VLCSPVTCGDYAVPANSLVRRMHQGRGLNETRLPGEVISSVLFGETLTVTCDASFHISTSTFEECEASFSMSCTDKGQLVSQDVSEPRAVSCRAPQKRVQCAACFKFWGTPVEDLQSRFPKLAALDCNAGFCEPPYAQQHYQAEIAGSEVWAKDDCLLQVRDSKAAPCLPVLCRPISLPPNAAKFVYRGVEYGTEGGPSSLPPITCGEELKVVCEAAFAPEHMLAPGAGCQDNSYNMTCDGTGYWEGFQKCVPKACVVSDHSRLDRQHSISVAVGAHHIIKCPAGHEVQFECEGSLCGHDFAPVCRDSCLMSVNQSCHRVQCTYNHTGRHQLPTSAQAAFGDNITVACESGYVSFASLSEARCQGTFYPTCQADGLFDHQGDSCVEPQCPPYHSVDENVWIEAATLMPFRQGSTIRVRCKAEYGQGQGFGLNASDLPATAFTIPGEEYVFERTCQGDCRWSPERHCRRVPCRCRAFDDYLKQLSAPGGGTIYARLPEGKQLSSSGSREPLQCPVGGYCCER